MVGKDYQWRVSVILSEDVLEIIMELEHEAYKFKISEKEYESLREEIIQRIILINTQANNTFFAGYEHKSGA